MPKALERKLKKQAKKKGFGKKRTGRYVYGTINKLKSGKHGSASVRNMGMGY